MRCAPFRSHPCPLSWTPAQISKRAPTPPLERAAAPAAAGQGDDLDCQAVPCTAEAVSFAFEFHAIMSPAREFEARVRRAQEQIEHPEEGRALKAFHTADLPANRVSRAATRGCIQSTALRSCRVIWCSSWPQRRTESELPAAAERR